MTALRAALPLPPSDTALRLCRGVRRALAARGQISVAEVPLASGRRADILAVDAGGLVTIVEIKSSVTDFRTDHKWPDYVPFCDRFYFAVDERFPLALVPETCGLMVADAYDAAFLREPAEHRLNPARRRSVLLRFARTAALRLHRLEDPGGAGDG